MFGILVQTAFFTRTIKHLPSPAGNNMHHIVCQVKPTLSSIYSTQKYQGYDSKSPVLPSAGLFTVHIDIMLKATLTLHQLSLETQSDISCDGRTQQCDYSNTLTIGTSREHCLSISQLLAQCHHLPAVKRSDLGAFCMKRPPLPTAPIDLNPYSIIQRRSRMQQLASIHMHSHASRDRETPQRCPSIFL